VTRAAAGHGPLPDGRGSDERGRGDNQRGDVRIRLATPEDLGAINEIYNDYVPRSTCTFQTEPETPEGRRRWFDAHGTDHPVLVAERGGEIVGWGSINPFKPRRAYRMTVDDSIYIRHDCHRQGIGRLLLSDLIERAASLGYHTMLAGIAADQPASIVLRQRLRFVQCAHLREVGFKSGRWIDVLYFQRMLAR